MQVSIRELKSSLSAYLRQVSGGETLVITSRKKPLARITAYDNLDGVDESLHQLLSVDGVQWDGRIPELPAKQSRLDGQPAAQAVIQGRR